MIFWITGEPCSGKSTLMKSLVGRMNVSSPLNKLISFGNGKCMKINNTLVMGNYLGKGKCPGLDYLQPSLTNLEMFIKKEYPKYDILIETFLSRY